ncbi:uncharacterized protein VNE69_02138 [Vairimorpha necatrix]|uniref:Uncharacterized protein n=1 Tax=Vairimorpha necatrix TaxID=6039 RepID=A0AAX4J9I0_9MICR
MWVILIVKILSCRSCSNCINTQTINNRNINVSKNTHEERKFYTFNMFLQEIEVKDNEIECKFLDKVDNKIDIHSLPNYTDLINISHFMFRILKQNKEIKYLMSKIHLTDDERKHKKILRFDKYIEFVVRFANNEPFLHYIEKSLLFIEFSLAGFSRFSKRDFNKLEKSLGESISVLLKKSCPWKYLMIFDSGKLIKINEELVKVKTKDLQVQTRYSYENINRINQTNIIKDGIKNNITSTRELITQENKIV